MFRKFLVMAVVAVTAALTAPSRSEATFTLTLDSGTSSVLIMDGGIGDLDGIVNGSIVASKTFDNFEFNVTASTSSPDGFTSGGVLSITQATKIRSTSAAAAGVPVVTVFSDGFAFGGAPVSPKAKLTNTIASSLFTGSTGNAGGTSTINAPGGAAGTTAVAQVNAPLSGSGANQTTLLVTVSSTPFSLSNKLTINNLGASNTFTGSLSTTADLVTPAPAGLLLAAFGIPAFGLLRRITRKSGAAQVAV